MTDGFAVATGANIKSARINVRLTQAALSRRSGVGRSQIVKMEAGQVIPQLDEAVRIADVLHVPIQSLLTGKNRPSVGLKGTAHELYDLGIRDWIVSDAEVPGAFRRPEQVIALALRGDRPEVRILEALPYVLSRRRLDARLALAFAEIYDPRVKTRLAWLCDVTMTLGRQALFSIAPEVEQSLERLVKAVKKPKAPDGLGHPSDGPLSPVWRRWNITYAGSMKSFAERSGQFSAVDRTVELFDQLATKTAEEKHEILKQIQDSLGSFNNPGMKEVKRRLGIEENGPKAKLAKKLAEAAAKKAGGE